jgi:hypothetical protein
MPKIPSNYFLQISKPQFLILNFYFLICNMQFLKKLFGGKKPEKAQTVADFWQWFQQQEKNFFGIVKNNGAIEEKFFDPVLEQLTDLDGRYFLVTGMHDAETAELIFTAEGIVQNFVFVEELVQAAPNIKGWKFTALKPAIDALDGLGLKMDNYVFNKDNIFFYSNESPEYPDSIDLTLVYRDFEADSPDHETVFRGCCIFLDNYLGEYYFTSTIDSLELVPPTMAEKEQIPIEKLKAFLIWRQKEFVEKYESTRHHAGNDRYAVMEATTADNKPLVATFNTDLLQWDAKPSHPWMAVVEFSYDGSQNNGMPTANQSVAMNDFEDRLAATLLDADGYLNIGRQTGDNKRQLFIACKEFKNASKQINTTIKANQTGTTISYEIYNDKYWQSVNQFQKTY